MSHGQDTVCLTSQQVNVPDYKHVLQTCWVTSYVKNIYTVHV